MGTELALFITHYGYLAVFSLIFIQELGVPNPVPNEVILLFAGSLAAVGTLSFPLIFLVAVLADFLGTSILYFFFYAFRRLLTRRPPKWLPVKAESLKKLSDLIARRDQWGIFLGRLIPYLRGYASVAAGILGISPRVFLPVVFLSAAVWSGGYVLLGNALGRRVENFLASFGGIQEAFVIVSILFILFFAMRHVYGHFKNKDSAQK